MVLIRQAIRYRATLRTHECTHIVFRKKSFTAAAVRSSSQLAQLALFTPNFFGHGLSSTLRYSSSWSSPAKLDWAEMSPTQHAAWKQLGWVERSWEGLAEPPPSDAAKWADLSPAEQAAAQYGLGYSAQTWDDELLGLEQPSESKSRISQSISSTPAQNQTGSSAAASVAPKSRFTGLLSSVARAARVGSDLVETGLDFRKDPIGGLMDLASGGAATIDQTEAIVYLDDSGSMANARNLSEAHTAFDSFAPLLASTPTRVVIFGSNKFELIGRQDTLDSNRVKESWRGGSGGTYMWHMIERDVTKRYKPGPGTLRIYVVTDGEDMLSPYPYMGMNGMNPLMEGLLARGYKIEWTIVSVGLNAKAAAPYRDLCLATGGAFLNASVSPPSSSASKRFLGEVQRAHARKSASGKEAARIEEGVRKDREAARLAYERSVANGTAQRFDWYTALPPPPKRK